MIPNHVGRWEKQKHHISVVEASSEGGQMFIEPTFISLKPHLLKELHDQPDFLPLRVRALCSSPAEPACC